MMFRALIRHLIEPTVRAIIAAEGDERARDSLQALEAAHPGYGPRTLARMARGEPPPDEAASAEIRACPGPTR